MILGRNLLAHWYYHVPDLVMAALIYLLVVRLLLSLVLPRDTGIAAARLIDAVTGPVLKGVGALTPRLVPGALVVVAAMAWLLAARVALFMGVAATGVRLSMG
jgi:YggT family protein